MLVLVSILLFPQTVLAAPVPVRTRNFSSQLDRISAQVVRLERDLIYSLKAQRSAGSRIRKIRKLQRLHRLEKRLSVRRFKKLELVVKELESRRNFLRARIRRKQGKIRRFLTDLDRSYRQPFSLAEDMAKPQMDPLDSPKRKALVNLVDHHLKAIETLRIDLVDADHLEERIESERNQLSYLLEEIKEKASLLEFHKQLQLDVLRRSYSRRLAQLEEIERLRRAEGQVKHLLSELNARKEFERAAEEQKVVARSMMSGSFLKQKGRLAFPTRGRVISSFGKAFDERLKLTIFKKGIDIQPGSNAIVSAIFAGKVAYSGRLPGYGNVLIVDHGQKYYSLIGRLGKRLAKKGQLVRTGQKLGVVDRKGTPIYFEIRSRNVAVNPLLWVGNQL